jgi:hypothetical protein
VAIEVKSPRTYRRKVTARIGAFRSGVNARGVVVYRGDTELEIDGVRVLPFEVFARRLHAGEILG